MTVEWRDITRASSDEELRAAVTDRNTVLDGLLALADRLEATGAPEALLNTLEFAVRVGGVGNVVARRDALLASTRLHADTTDDHVAGVTGAACALADGGDAPRAIDTYLRAASLLISRGREDDAVALGIGALDVINRHPEALTVSRADAYSMIAPSALRAADNLIRLADRLSDAATKPNSAAVVARAAAALRVAGLEDLRPLVGISLGCLLVRLGDAESGVEILRDWVNRFSTVEYAGAAIDKARLWYAVGLHQSGRFDQALDAFYSHPWWSSADETQRLDLTAATARLLIDQRRLTEALDLLSGSDLADSPLLTAMRARVDAELGRPSTVATQPGDEGGPWAKLASLEHIVIIDPQAAAIPAGLDASFAPRGVCHYLSTLLGDLARAHGDIRQALRHYEAAMDALLTPAAIPGWKEHWHGRAGQPWGPDITTDRERQARRGRGVGAELYLRMAFAQQALGQDPAETIRSAIEAATRRNQHATLFAALRAEAQRKRRAGRPATEWRPDLERAADILEGLRGRLRDEELQISALTEQDDVYGQLLQTALDLGDVDAALRVLERAKARTLLDRASATAEPFDELSAADRDEARALRESVVRALGRRLTDPWAPDDVGPLKRRLATVFRLRRPPSVGATAAATPGQVHRIATNGTLLLHYFCTPDHISLVPVGPADAAPIPKLDLTPDDIHAYLDVERAERQVRGASHSLTELYRGLLAPVEPLLNKAERLLVVPHGVLHSVPFAALRHPDGKYLVEQMPVVNAPSAAMAFRAGARLATPPSGDVGFAFGVELASYLPMASLAGVPDELNALQAQLPDIERLDQSQARRQALLDLVGEFDILHFACHAEFDPDDALLSRLYLADGPVYGYELLTLRARPRLVVFSACETGQHERLPGDEAMGLVRPFLGAGAGTVIATLWEVPDASTTELMSVFYREYRSHGHDPGACLRTAQLHLLHSERFSHPHYWAPYVAIGGYPNG
jgi:tetratricopeptide (TPR) repeat protein